MKTDQFMQQAIQMALESVRSGGGPFAALVVRNGTVLGAGSNRVIASNDPTAHAEVVAIRAACAALGDFQLKDCDIYTTSEPCPMCLGAIYWARPRRVFFGANAGDAAAAGFDDAFIYEQIKAPFGQRKIPFIPLMREEALKCFQAWLAKPDRASY
ncbi:MAG TPA: nucleoside deaminase [Bryobacteraceae bacterium]|nr:nucleoside deaminase [Bryobacteraceae bacterium]